MKNSKIFQELLRNLERQIFNIIKEYLDKNKSLKFTDSSTLMTCYPSHIMKGIRKVKRGYLLDTDDSGDGHGAGKESFYINDWSAVLIEDLIFILEEIEKHMS